MKKEKPSHQRHPNQQVTLHLINAMTGDQTSK